MSFGAWCDRQYGFDYRGVRAHRGLAWFPTFNEGVAEAQKAEKPILLWVMNGHPLACT